MVVSTFASLDLFAFLCFYFLFLEWLAVSATRLHVT